MNEWMAHASLFIGGMAVAMLAALIYSRYEIRVIIRKYAPMLNPVQDTEALGRLAELNEVLAVKEAALLKANAKFRALFELAPVLINSFNTDGSIDLWNRECERILGYTREELEKVDDIMTLFYDPSEIPLVWKDIKEARGIFKEYLVRTKSGRKIRMAWANMSIPGGTQIGVGYELKKVPPSDLLTSSTAQSEVSPKKAKARGVRRAKR